MDAKKRPEIFLLWAIFGYGRYLDLTGQTFGSRMGPPRRREAARSLNLTFETRPRTPHGKGEDFDWPEKRDEPANRIWRVRARLLAGRRGGKCPLFTTSRRSVDNGAAAVHRHHHRGGGHHQQHHQQQAPCTTSTSWDRTRMVVLKSLAQDGGAAAVAMTIIGNFVFFAHRAASPF